MARLRPVSAPLKRPLCGRLTLLLGPSLLWFGAAAQEAETPMTPTADAEAGAPAEEPLILESAEAEIPSETQLTRLETQIAFLDLVDERRFEEALPYAETMVELTEAEFGSPSAELATALANLAYIRRSLQDFDESNETFAGAIEMFRELEGPFTPSVINPLVSMGANFHANGEYFQALNLFEEARTVNRRAYGLLNPDQIEIVYHISATLTSMRRYEEAHQQQQDALSLIHI